MAPSQSPPDKPVVVYSSGKAASSPPHLRLLHYNDVYHLDPASAEPVGGVGRFITVCNEYRDHERFRGQPELVTLFSGDAFNPSLESSVTGGSHMVPLLNMIGTDCAAVGNHDLDFGVQQFEHLTSQCNFPWLLANVLDPALGGDVPVGNAKRTHIITASNGIKIGLIGLGEREWLETVNALPTVVYRSATATARELVPALRAAGCELVIALTHQREPNDLKLARQLDGLVDLVLGGHDHFYNHELVDGHTHVLRSGTDFKQLSYIELRRRRSGEAAGPGRWDVDIYRRDMVSSVAQDQDAVALVDTLTAKLKKSLDKPVGWTAAPLDARFSTVRTRESNIANLVCDIMTAHYGADCAMMAGGTIRADQVYPPGPIRIKDITDLFPFEDPCVVLKVNGSALWDALENGVSLFPALEGRFVQVANIKYVFCPSRPAGSRVQSVEVAGGPLERDRVYVLVTRGYMARGKDGFRSLLAKSEGGECEEVVDEESGILVSTMLRQYFLSLKVLDRWSHWGDSMQHHWDKVLEDVGKKHPHVESRPSTPVAQKKARKDGGDQEGGVAGGAGDEHDAPAGWANLTPERVRTRRTRVGIHDENQSAEAGEAENDRDLAATEDVRGLDQDLQVMRTFFRKWCRRAGVQSQASDSTMTEEECAASVPWTRAVAPQVEGRIVIVGEDDV